MDRLRHNTVLRAVKLLDAILLTIPFGLCWYGVYAGSLAEPYFQKGNWLVIALFLVLYITYGRIYEGFRITLSRISEMIVSQALSALIADGILYLKHICISNIIIYIHFVFIMYSEYNQEGSSRARI